MELYSHIPFLFVLITEIEEARGVEQQLHQVMRYQQNQAQAVETVRKLHHKIQNINTRVQLTMKQMRYMPPQNSLLIMVFAITVSQ